MPATAWEVDTVASATVTSTAVLTAAADALAQAGVTLEPVEVEEEAKEPAKPTFENPDVIVIGAGFSGMERRPGSGHQWRQGVPH